MGLFARYSNALDYLAKDLVVEMLKGRLPQGAQRRLVDVTVKRDKEAEKDERAKLKAKAVATADAEKKEEKAETDAVDEDGDKTEESPRKAGKKADRDADDASSSSDDDTDDEQAAAIAVSASAAGKPAPAAVRKRYIIKRHRREPTAVRKVSESSFADLCFASLATISSTDAQNLLHQEILRIRDEDGRAIFRPTN